MRAYLIHYHSFETKLWSIHKSPDFTWYFMAELLTLGRLPCVVVKTTYSSSILGSLLPAPRGLKAVCVPDNQPAPWPLIRVHLLLPNTS